MPGIEDDTLLKTYEAQRDCPRLLDCRLRYIRRFGRVGCPIESQAWRSLRAHTHVCRRIHVAALSFLESDAVIHRALKVIQGHIPHVADIHVFGNK